MANVLFADVDRVVGYTSKDVLQSLDAKCRLPSRMAARLDPVARSHRHEAGRRLFELVSEYVVLFANTRFDQLRERREALTWILEDSVVSSMSIHVCNDLDPEMQLFFET